MKEYKAGIYLRLSKEDREINNSIDAQREITTSFAKKNNYKIVKEYVDNGYSGILKSRPCFDEMIKDIINKKINMVIVKDISRLTRDKNLTSFYMDIFFPDNDIRFISVTEYIDSGEMYEIDDTISLRGIINESYLEDLSKKIKSVKNAFKEDGKFIENSVLYGYKKDENDKYKIVIDKPAAEVVRKIFELYINGANPSEISQYLNSKDIQTPSQYKNLKNNSKYWTVRIVNRILNDPTYTGKMVLNKYYNDFRLKKRCVTKIQDYKYKEDSHQAIITNEEFELARKRKRARCSMPQNTYIFLLRDLVFCKNCGRKMTYKNSNPTYINKNGEIKGRQNEKGYFLCEVHYRNKEICDKTYKILEKDLNSIVLKTISKRLKEIGLESYIEDVTRICEKNLGPNDQLRKLKKEKDNLEKNFKLLYAKRVDECISEEEFKEEYDIYQERITKIKQKIEELEKNSININLKNHLKKILDDFKSTKKFTNKIIKEFIEKVEIGENNSVDIKLKF